LIGLLWFLLPGFISAGLFRSLISNPKPSGFDSVSQVFVFTVIVQVIGWLIFSFVIETENNSNFSTENHAIVVFVHLLISIVVGILSSLIWNKDWLFKLLRKTKVTEQSSYHSAQYSAFAYYKNCYDSATSQKSAPFIWLAKGMVQQQNRPALSNDGL